ncbi:MAG: diguanylate cyclase [Zoogloeaceae bacterium]|nr:diguanylate cyclase [Zoogloeaceae bacterium]
MVASVLLLAIFAVAGNEIHLMHQAAYERARTQIESASHALANQTEQLLLAVDLSLAATQAELRRLTPLQRKEPERVSRLLNAHAAGIPAIANMGFIGADGWLVSHSEVATPPPQRFDDRPYFIAARDSAQDQIVIDEPTVGRVSGKRLIFVARRVVDEDQHFLGVVVASIDTRWLVNMLHSLSNAPGSTAVVFRSDGRLLARYPDIDEAYGRSYAGRDLFTRHLPSSPAGAFSDVSGLDDEPRLIYYQMLHRYPVVVLAATDESLLITHWRGSALRIGGSALIAALLVVMLFYVIYRQLHQLELQARHLRQQAQTDALTGLPNRALFEDRLERALASATRKQRQAAILFIDLDKFKAVNDSLGHAAGDQLLQEVSMRLAACLRVMDTVSRLGGDEFTVLLPEIESENDAISVAEKITAAIARPVDISGHEVHVTCSVGIALFPEDADEAGSLLRHADFAMYSAKAAGHNGWQRYRRQP